MSLNFYDLVIQNISTIYLFCEQTDYFILRPFFFFSSIYLLPKKHLNPVFIAL